MVTINRSIKNIAKWRSTTKMLELIRKMFSVNRFFVITVYFRRSLEQNEHPFPDQIGSDTDHTINPRSFEEKKVSLTLESGGRGEQSDHSSTWGGVGAVAKISASQSWGPQFDSRLGRGLNIWVTFFPVKVHSAFHPPGVGKMSTSIHGPLWSGCQRRLYMLPVRWG